MQWKMPRATNKEKYEFCITENEKMRKQGQCLSFNRFYTSSSSQEWLLYLISSLITIAKIEFDCQMLNYLVFGIQSCENCRVLGSMRIVTGLEFSREQLTFWEQIVDVWWQEHSIAGLLGLQIAILWPNFWVNNKILSLSLPWKGKFTDIKW